MPLTLAQMFQRFRKTFQLESWGGKLRKKNNSSEWRFLLAKLLHLKYNTYVCIYKGNTWMKKGLWKHWHYWQLKSQQWSKTKHTNAKLHTKIIYFSGGGGGGKDLYEQQYHWIFLTIILSFAIIKYSIAAYPIFRAEGWGRSKFLPQTIMSLGNGHSQEGERIHILNGE